jgi:hypothetical protein
MPDLNDLKARANARGFIEGEVLVTLDDLLDGDREWLFDAISEQLTGTIILTDLFYKPLSVTDYGYIRLLAGGNISDILDEFEDTPHDTPGPFTTEGTD